MRAPAETAKRKAQSGKQKLLAAALAACSLAALVILLSKLIQP